MLHSPVYLGVYIVEGQTVVVHRAGQRCNGGEGREEGLLTGDCWSLG